MPKKHKKCYIILSTGKKYCYGAFPFTKTGKLDAEVFVKHLKETQKEHFKIISK